MFDKRTVRLDKAAILVLVIRAEAKAEAALVKLATALIAVRRWALRTLKVANLVRMIANLAHPQLLLAAHVPTGYAAFSAKCNRLPAEKSLKRFEKQALATEHAATLYALAHKPTAKAMEAVHAVAGGF
jgi:hypothetical protein